MGSSSLIIPSPTPSIQQVHPAPSSGSTDDERIPTSTPPAGPSQPVPSWPRGITRPRGSHGGQPSSSRPTPTSSAPQPITGTKRQRSSSFSNIHPVPPTLAPAVRHQHSRSDHHSQPSQPLPAATQTHTQGTPTTAGYVATQQLLGSIQGLNIPWGGLAAGHMVHSGLGWQGLLGAARVLGGDLTPLGIRSPLAGLGQPLYLQQLLQQHQLQRQVAAQQQMQATLALASQQQLFNPLLLWLTSALATANPLPTPNATNLLANLLAQRAPEVPRPMSTPAGQLPTPTGPGPGAPLSTTSHPVGVQCSETPHIRATQPPQTLPRVQQHVGQPEAPPPADGVPAYQLFSAALAPPGVGLSPFYLALINSAGQLAGAGDATAGPPGGTHRESDIAAMLAWHQESIAGGTGTATAGVLAVAAESHHPGWGQGPGLEHTLGLASQMVHGGVSTPRAQHMTHVDTRLSLNYSPSRPAVPAPRPSAIQLLQAAQQLPHTYATGTGGPGHVLGPSLPRVGPRHPTGAGGKLPVGAGAQPGGPSQLAQSQPVAEKSSGAPSLAPTAELGEADVATQARPPARAGSTTLKLPPQEVQGKSKGKEPVEGGSARRFEGLEGMGGRVGRGTGRGVQRGGAFMGRGDREGLEEGDQRQQQGQSGDTRGQQGDTWGRDAARGKGAKDG